MTSWAVNPDARVLVIGGGYTGQRFAASAAAAGARVWLTRRSAPEAGNADGLQWLRFDPANGHHLTALPDGLSHVLVTLPTGSDDSDAALDHLLPALRQQPLAWLGYLSTTGVYGDSGGAWVDEDSPTEPPLPRSPARLRCEPRWLASGLPVMRFR
ncbi:MAG: SDR family NAD(P)-dependent oxidoreductase, partial [Vulcanococcus sp.]